MNAPDEASDAQLSARIEAALARHQQTLDGAVWRVCCKQWGVWSGPAVGELLRLVRMAWGSAFDNFVSSVNGSAVTCFTNHTETGKRSLSAILSGVLQFTGATDTEALATALESAPV